MAQEWIFANFQEKFDQWDEDDGDGNLTQYRRYKGYLERYIKYIPPYVGARYNIGSSERVYALECYANGVPVDLSVTTDPEIVGEEPGFILTNRVFSFSPNEAGVVLVTESWELTGELQVYDPETNTWAFVNAL